jgi:hypothetical protein
MKKTYWLYAIILLSPVLVNCLMFIPFGLASDNITWVNFFGSYLGGVVSGLLTLQGVRLTIQGNRDKDYYDSLPKKIMFIEDIIFILERQNELLHKNNEDTSPSVKNPRYRERIKFILQYLEEDGLLDKSSKVNLETYRITRNLYDYLKKLNYSHKSGVLPYREIDESIINCIQKLKSEHIRFIDTLKLSILN